MSTKQTPLLELDELQLKKLTSESEEIRMRALDQVETRFIRCLQLGEPISFKPALLMKQLIRWFEHSPPLAADRVLGVMLELLRSKYGPVVVRKMTYDRMTAELGKMRRILRPLECKRITDLLDELQYLLHQRYDVHLETPSVISLSSVNLTSDGTTDSMISSIRDVKGSLTQQDYEPAWTQPCPRDVTSLQSLMDLPRNGETDVSELHVKLTHMSIRMGDYPAEYFLQAPYIFLLLVKLQDRHDGSLEQVNRTIITYLKQLQRRIDDRYTTMCYATTLDAPRSRPKQVRVESALGVLLTNCTVLITMCRTSDIWHILELAKEALRTYEALNAPVTPVVADRIGNMVKELLDFCKRQTGPNLEELVSSLLVPRMKSLIFNALMMEVTILNLRHDKHLNRAYARALLHPVLLDSCYMSFVPGRMTSLGDLRGALLDNPADEKPMCQLTVAYTTALAQLQPATRMKAPLLLESYQEICLVVNQLGSRTLVRHLFDAIVQCTSLYQGNPKLRACADELLCALMDLPDKGLRWFLYGLMRKPVTSHFHAFMNKTAYMSGCSNLELVRQNILGLPMTTRFMRKLILQSADKEAPEDVRRWCLDHLILLLKLNSFLAKKDLQNFILMVFPLVPLLICRSITDAQLNNVMWHQWEPENCILDPARMLQVYVCYLFHPHRELRENVAVPIANMLESMLGISNAKPFGGDCQTKRGGVPDMCAIEPPLDYRDIFTETSAEAFQGQRSLEALVRLLNAREVRPAIRKSSMTQLNVMLRNWKACECFTTKDGVSLVMFSLPNALRQDIDGDPADILQPAVGILLKLMLQKPDFREKVAHTPDLYLNLLRPLVLLPHKTELRQNASICLFLMLFYDSFTATAEKLVLHMDLGGLVSPVTYEVATPEPSSAVIEGIKLQRHLEQTYFGGDVNSSAQHWRLISSQFSCKSPSLEALQSVDIRSELKLTQNDLAIMRASQSDLLLRNHLVAASNCSSHADLQEKVDVLQLFIVHMRTSVPEAECKSLWQVIHKYIRSAPGNEADRKLYMSLVALCLSCLRYFLPHVVRGLAAAIQADPNHSFLLLLQDMAIPLDMLHLITQCMECLLLAEGLEEQMDWHGVLFVQLSAVAKRHFDLRQLQHVRCILRVLRSLSERELMLSHEQVMHYCQHFMQLSSDLRTSTQTGAQWQRDCLHIICELHVHHADTTGNLNAMREMGATNKVLRYLLSLCGHCDSEVRALSWVLMADWIIICDVRLESILASLEFVPGGLPGCCMTTLLDIHEVNLVRVLAGSVFILLMPLLGPQGCLDLMRKHTFLREASRALRTLHLPPQLTEQPTGELNSCEIISCYVAICVNMAELDPDWLGTLCKHSFMNTLSDVVKTPAPERGENSLAFYELCAEHICELYALCYENHFEFLQRSICRDTVFLERFVVLMEDVVRLEEPQRLLGQLFKMLLVFCKDSNAFGFLCEQLRTKPTFFSDFFTYGLHTSCKGTALQRYTLKCLSLIFIKSQSMPEEVDLVLHLEQVTMGLKPGSTAANPDKLDTLNPKEPTENHPKGIALVYQIMEQHFASYYAAKKFSFLQALDADHVQYCETLGAFLKYSKVSACIAVHTRLLDRIIDILDTFLRDEKIGNACGYVKRVGAHKSKEILNNLMLLLNLLAQWHSMHQSVISDPARAAALIHIFVRLWPWLSHSSELKQLSVQVIMFFTEHSFEMCRQTSVALAGHSHSLLQLMVRVADFETTRKETNTNATGDGACIVPALRVMSNCCSCSEGRQSLSKMHVLDMFDTILPTASQAYKVRPSVVQAWLAFWEVYSRYDVGAKACHLHSLIGIIRRLAPLNDRRTLSLRILRNMCFFNINRTVLTEMTEFVNMLRDIINQPVLQKHPTNGICLISFEEHRLAVLMVYKLFGFGAKYKAMLRGTKLLRLLTHLKEQLEGLKTEQPDRFQTVSFAPELAEMLSNLFAALEA